MFFERSRARTHRYASRSYRPALWTLEDRSLLSTAPLPALIIDPAPFPVQTIQLFPGPPVQTADLGTTSSGTGSIHSLSTVPALSSLPGAPASIYLNFLGDFTPSYGSYSNIITPAFDQDGDPTTFSDAELSSIQKIWSCVAEDYAPFDINVTTVPPVNMAHGVTEKVDIGGNGAWTGGKSGGLCYQNDFTVTSIPNIAFVFSQNLASGNARYTGDAASHESGHGFGLAHQSIYSGTTLIAEYSTGPGDGTAPLMGNSYAAQRSLWWYGTSDVSSTTYQDDMAVISGSMNGFGYRSEPADTTPASAFPLVVQNVTQVSDSGLIIHPSDQDYYSFTSGPGVVSFTISVRAGVNNLAPRIELLDATGSTVIASAGPSPTDFSATITTTLPTSGSYRILVASSDGHYGDVGQYLISGTVSPPSNPTGSPGSGTLTLNPPAAVSATAVSSGRIDLAWAAVAGATGFQIERSTGQGNWILVGTTTNGGTSFSDLSVTPATTYVYFVRAIGPGLSSAPSTAAAASTPPVPVAPATVGGLNIVARTARQVVLTWTPNISSAQRCTVERSTNGKNWVVVGRLAAGSSGFTDNSVAPGKSYFYRVRTYYPRGISMVGPMAKVLTPRAPVQPLRKKAR